LLRLKYSRLLIPRKAREDAIVGLLSLHEPLGFVEEGRDLVACFRDPEAARAAQRDLEARRVRCDLVTEIPEEDPLEAFRVAARPFPVGRSFWIDPGEPSDSEAPAGRIALRLPASRAFGTGGHESTRLVLLALEEEPPCGLTVLDAGTGSGVLALAATALGARFAVGFDTDADAVFVAEANRRRHAFGDRVALVVADLDAIAGEFDLVLANLLPEELLPLRRGLLRRVAPGGRAVFSGIPREREEEVLTRMRSRSWRLAGRRSENEWASLCLERGSF
jgi:ribosomal protein L11 methyltransferase